MSVVNYSVALRCIGQDLERRGLKTFDIKREGSSFIAVYGHQEPASAAKPENVHYTPADIEILDRCGEGQRGKYVDKNFMNSAQILRAIGDHLDKYGSNLIRITNNDTRAEAPLFRVEYITREGEHVIDDRPGAAIFDMCVLMYQKRGRPTGTHGGSGTR
jgi:hypothetical protein